MNHGAQMEYNSITQHMAETDDPWDYNCARKELASFLTRNHGVGPMPEMREDMLPHVVDDIAETGRFLIKAQWHQHRAETGWWVDTKGNTLNHFHDKNFHCEFEGRQYVMIKGTMPKPGKAGEFITKPTFYDAKTLEPRPLRDNVIVIIDVRFY